MPYLFFTGILLSAFMSSALIIILLFIKRLFVKHLGVRWQYTLWFLLILVLLMPFAPKNLYRIVSHLELDLAPIQTYFYKSETNLPSVVNTQLGGSNDDNWMHDFSLSVNRLDSQVIFWLTCFWGLGVAILFIATVIMNRKANALSKEIRIIKNIEMLSLYEDCKKDLKLRKIPLLAESSFIKAPMLVGIFKTTILLPMGIADEVTGNDIRHMLLHELCHYKSKDVISNYVICFLQIVYWFNPLVWYAFKQMRIDREIACDNAVLKTMNEKSYKDYGMTLINFLDKVSNPLTFALASGIGMSDSKRQIEKRIKKIATFKRETKMIKWKSLVIFVVAGTLLLTNAGLLSTIQAANLYDDPIDSHIQYEDYSGYFEGGKGSFVLYDLQNDQYQIYNKAKSVERVSPNSTYKLISALMGLESGVLEDENTMLRWNGTSYPYEEWNKDHTLYSAMKASANWYFQAVDSQVGEERMKYYYKQLKYGNRDITGGADTYWLQSTLKISPVEQVQILKELYTYESVFSRENIDKVKNIIKISENDGAVLSGKTGSGAENDKKVSGWFIGYVEKEGNVFFFATYIQDRDQVDSKRAVDITLSILEDKNLYYGG